MIILILKHREPRTTQFLEREKASMHAGWSGIGLMSEEDIYKAWLDGDLKGLENDLRGDKFAIPLTTLQTKVRPSSTASVSQISNKGA